MRRIMLVALLAISGVTFAAKSTKAPSAGEPMAASAKIIDAAMGAVRDGLKDPESARFRGVFIASNGSVCGEVNAKNEYGGYVGFRHFMLEHDGGLFFDDSGPSFPGLIAMGCKK